MNGSPIFFILSEVLREKNLTLQLRKTALSMRNIVRDGPIYSCMGSILQRSF